MHPLASIADDLLVRQAISPPQRDLLGRKDFLTGQKSVCERGYASVYSNDPSIRSHRTSLPLDSGVGNSDFCVVGKKSSCTFTPIHHLPQWVFQSALNQRERWESAVFAPLFYRFFKIFRGMGSRTLRSERALKRASV